MRVPHPIPYQGSKRRLAAAILGFAPSESERLIEPFAGSAAVTLAAAARGVAGEYVIGDSLEPLTSLWRNILNDPEGSAERYRSVWTAQLPDPRRHYNEVREEFSSTGDPILLLYLIARCVKNAVRFNPRGEFNQSADHRRKGMHPDKMADQMRAASHLLQGRCSVVHADYRGLLAEARSSDLVYMDPPYRGVSRGRDSRYFEQLDFDGFLDALADLTARDVPFLLSFDGMLGDKDYGPPLPSELGLRRVTINAGRSSQATLLGRTKISRESLYLSPNLAELAAGVSGEILLTTSEKSEQQALAL